MNIYEIELKKKGEIEYDGVLSGDEIKDVAKMIRTYGLHKCTEEHLILLTFDVGYVLTGIFEIAHGTPERACYEIKDIMKRALLINASGIAVAHNHTTQAPGASNADIHFTKELAHICKLMGIYLVDHQIIGKTGKVYSMHDEGDLEGMGNLKQEYYDLGYRDGLDMAGVNLKAIDENSKLRKKRISEISKQTIRKNRR
jgi:hypothetical protein